MRLPGFSVSTDVVFGLPDERFTIRYDAGMAAQPCVAGTLLVHPLRVVGHSGSTRGLDTILIASASG